MFVKNCNIMSGGSLSNYHEYWSDVIADNIVDVIKNNFQKINRRVNTNTQHGEGDNREE